MKTKSVLSIHKINQTLQLSMDCSHISQNTRKSAVLKQVPLAAPCLFHSVYTVCSTREHSFTNQKKLNALGRGEKIFWGSFRDNTAKLQNIQCCGGHQKSTNQHLHEQNLFLTIMPVCKGNENESNFVLPAHGPYFLTRFGLTRRATP